MEKDREQYSEQVEQLLQMLRGKTGGGSGEPSLEDGDSPVSSVAAYLAY